MKIKDKFVSILNYVTDEMYKATIDKQKVYINMLKRKNERHEDSIRRLMETHGYKTTEIFYVIHNGIPDANNIHKKGK